MALRFSTAAAEAMRSAIQEAGGIEIFAVGDVDSKGEVQSIEVHARGTQDAVLALRSRPRAGQVVIHNHPSGVIRPSPADTELAGTFGEEGVGFVIVDNAVSRSQWVVEPHKKRRVRVDPAEVDAIFLKKLPALMPGWEARPGQVELAHRVLGTFNDGGTVLLEAGTGTGKSLGYLVPAGLWALANDAKVLVSTYTKTLQGQLLSEDLPLLARLLPLRYAALKGRSNYVCRRKLGLAGTEEPLEAIRAWATTTATGDREDLGLEIDEDLWDRIQSDTDQTLRARCPHFNTCFYYQARRTAAAAHLIVANHALLLSDLSLKNIPNATGILPAFDRVVLDEAHHLEAAATSVAEVRLSHRQISRGLSPLLNSRRRAGALEKLAQKWPHEVGPAAGEAGMALSEVKDHAGIGFSMLKAEYTVPERVQGPTPHQEFFAELAQKAEEAAGRLGAVQAKLEPLEIKVEEAQPVLDLGRGRRKLEDVAGAARSFLKAEENACRYFDPGNVGVGAVKAPVDVGPALQKLLERLEGVVLTSATLTVHGKIDHYAGRLGFEDLDFSIFPSPFQYKEQALLVLPKDIPPPDAPDYVDVAAKWMVDAIEASGGGAFILCTSHAAVQEFARRLEAALGSRHAILVQGKGSKGKILDHFRRDRAAVLLGTDSFWEGISVKGEGLRLVIIPRLPFRVPTEPVAQTRYERIRDRGLDPFRAYALPEAVIKLRQGFGRLIRSRTDRGAVLILDRRIHEMWYGRIFLASLPDARRLVGPGRAILPQLRAFYQEWLQDNLDTSMDEIPAD